MKATRGKLRTPMRMFTATWLKRCAAARSWLSCARSCWLYAMASPWPNPGAQIDAYVDAHQAG